MPELNAPPEPGAAEIAGENNDLRDIRDLVLRAYPDIVPELVTGDSLQEILGSIGAARDAFARLTEKWADAHPEPIAVPAGGGRSLPVDPALLPPSEKIRRGLQAASRNRA